MNLRRRAALVRIVALLTASPVVSAGERLGKDRMFIRFTNLRTDGVQILIRLNIVPNNDQPFGWADKTIYVVRDKEGERPDASRPASCPGFVARRACSWCATGWEFALKVTHGF
jgi:hypothetical protein